MSPTMKRAYQYFFRGLIAILPVALTLYLLYIFLAGTEAVALFVLKPFIGGFYFPGLGMLVGIGLIIALGYALSKTTVRKLLSFVELPFNTLPVVSSVYSSLKSFADYFSPASEQTKPQQQVVVLRMPGHELEMVGLITRQNLYGMPEGFSKEDRVAVYLPMGYNIGGYTLFVPRGWTTPIAMTVEEAMRSSLIAWMARTPTDPEPPAQVPPAGTPFV